MAEKLDKLVDEWMPRIEIARDFREDHFMKDWVYWENVYDDKLWGKRKARSSAKNRTVIPQVNELESIVLTLLPKLWHTEPVFEIVADDQDWAVSALVWEKLAEVLMRLDVMNISSNIREIIIDSLILGGGVMKLGWGYDLEETAYNLGDGTAGEPFHRSEMPMASYVSPKSMLWDYDAVRWQDARWFVEEIDKPVEEVKKNDLYSHTKDLVGNKTSRSLLQRIRERGNDDNKNDIITLLEIHDLVKGKIITLAQNHNRTLREDDDYGFVLYQDLQLTPSRPMKMWGKSIAQSIEEHIIRLSTNHYYMDAHSRSGLSKWVFNNSMLDSAGKKALESSDMFALIGVDGSPAEAIQELKRSPINMDWFATTGVIEQAIRLLSGVSMQDRGKHETGVQTAFETAKLLEATNARTQDRLLQLNEFVRKIMSNILTIVSTNWPIQKVGELTGLQERYWPALQPFNRMKLNVKFGSTAMSSRLEKRESLLGFAQVMGAAGIQLDPVGFGRKAADAFGIDFNDRLVLFGEPGEEASTGSASRSVSSPQQQVQSSANSINSQV